MDKFKNEVGRVKEEPLNPKKRSLFLDKEVDIAIKINPKKTLKLFSIVLIFLIVFFLGRWTAPVGNIPDQDSASDSGGFFSSLTGLFHADDASTAVESEEMPAETSETSEPANAEIPEQTESTEQAVVAEEAKEVEEVVEEAPVEEEEEIITSYRKVSFTIPNVKIDWHDIWGKITHLDFTIQNNEEGTIKPKYFLMIVEGYPDENSKKKVPLPEGSKEIRSKTSASSSAVVPGGFNYNEKTTGNLDTVEIRFTLFDFNEKPVASFRKEYNLRG